ncbi:MAG: DUF1501 domain-containing protein [Planctomycetaceae bacterium]
MSHFWHDDRNPSLGTPRVSRREWLCIGGLSWLGLSESTINGLRRDAMARADEAQSEARLAAPAKRCVFIFLFGGPSQIDLWDLKTLAPENVRGIFQPIVTSAPAIQLSELLPNLAKQADKLCLLRSMTHGDPVHGTACSQVITGRPHRRPGTTDTLAPDDWPSLSAMVMRYGRATGGMPSSVVLPWYLMFPSQGVRIAGQSSGLMGEQHNAFLIDGDPSRDDFSVPGIRLPTDVPAARLLRREGLLREVDFARRVLNEGPRSQLVNDQYRQAFAMISGEQTAAAFDLDREPTTTRERYGSHKFGQSLLLARRLVERGVSLVSVNWDDETRDEKQSPFWDTHHDNFNRLRKLAPVFDRAFAAFLADLHERGLLDSTLVVALGEFGRTPKIGQFTQNGMTEKTGRDHWPHAFTALIAGGGVPGGQVFGATDRLGAYVIDKPVTPPDLAATMLTHLGVDPRQRYHAPLLGESFPLCIGHPIRDWS